MTKKDARQIIENLGEDTGYFTTDQNYKVSEIEFREMLRYRMGFGLAETECITAALILAGAFK